MDWARRATYGIAALVFLITASVYLATLTPTVPFWDAGEFIACSYILGIPHPPGTPLYVLLGRVATLVPWATVAQRINALSRLIEVSIAPPLGADIIDMTGAEWDAVSKELDNVLRTLYGQGIRPEQLVMAQGITLSAAAGSLSLTAERCVQIREQREGSTRYYT